MKQPAPAARPGQAGQAAWAPAGPGARARAGWRAVTGIGPAASLALALLLALCAFIAVAVPRASVGYRSAALDRLLASLSVTQKTVIGEADLGFGAGYLSPAALDLTRRQLAAGLAASGLPVAAGTGQWAGLAFGPGSLSGRFSLPRGVTAAAIRLLYRSSLAASTRLVAGHLPATVRPLAGDSALFQVAVTEATARSLRIRVGSRLAAGGQELQVTGIVAPARPGSSFWALQPDVGSPQIVNPPPSSQAAPYLAVAAFVGPGEVAGLQQRFTGETERALWSFPLGLGQASATQAAGLAAALNRLSYLPVLSSLAARLSTGTANTTGQTIVISLSNGLAGPLSAFVTEDDAVQAALSLLFVSLGLVAAVVVLLGAQAVTAHRGTELALMRARGASLARLAATVLAGNSLTVIPAALLAAAAAVVATPGPSYALPEWLGALVVATALAGPPSLAAWAHRPRRAATARLQPSRRTRRRVALARRLVLRGTLVCAAIAGLVVLRLQGPAAPGTDDLFTSAAPVLTAIPAAAAIAALLPAITAGLLRLAARSRGVAALLGLARGRTSSAGTLPVFALILALTLIAFAAMERSAVARGDVAASWQRAGADAVVTATGPGITARAQRMLARVPGAAHTAVLSVTTGTTGQGLPLPVVVVNPASYAALTAGSPAPRFPSGALRRHRAPGAAAATVPALVSPAAHGMLGNPGRLAVAGRDLRIRVARSVASMPVAPAGTAFTVLPRWALGSAALPATAIAISGPRLDTAAVAAAARRAVPGARLTLRARVLAAIAGAPLAHGGLVTMAQVGLAGVAMMLLVQLLTLVLDARSRERALARMVTMGLPAGQWRRVVLAETLPAVIAAIVGGTVCALVLVPLVGPAIRLAAFTGTGASVPLHADPVALAGADAGLLLLVVLVTGSQDWVARRRGAAQALRLGE